MKAGNVGMKKIPMILLLMAPGATLAICYLADLDLTPGLFVCGAILILNMVYAFLLPRLGFKGKQILFWNMLLKLSQVPLISLILLFTLVMAMVGGEGIGAVVIAALLVCWLLMLSSSVYGISGFLWSHKYGTLSKTGMIASMIAQLIPCVDVVGSILCYIMFRKEGETDT